MRKNLLLLSVSAILISFTASHAQQYKRCGTMELLAKQKAEDPTLQARMDAIEEMTQEFTRQTAGMRTSSTVVTIPVVFHILYHTTAQNISDARIFDQINTLNKDYAHLNADTGNTPAAFKPYTANTNIQFCLAQQDPNGAPTTGIIRKSVTVTGFDPETNNNIKYTSSGGDDAWDRNQYLNIWVSNFTGNSAQLLGISQFPGGAAATDGCCVLYGTVGGSTSHGTTQSYNLGRTLTHEVGHWLNLHHIWGDGSCSTGNNDYCADTPPQDGENYGCPTYPLINANTAQGWYGPSCTGTAPGSMFMNYMDYVDDNCMNMFTANQTTRITAAINGPRAAIKNSTRCVDLTGISNPLLAIQFSVYPNPSTGEIVVASQLEDRTDVTIIITNVLGEVVYKNEFKNLPYLVQTINLSDKANGIYVVEVRTGTAVANKKVLLNR